MTDDSRRVLDAARRKGLAARHAAKLARIYGATYHCTRCDEDMPVAAALEHLTVHTTEEDR